MTPRPSETVQVHTRLLKCALEVEDSRSYWRCWREKPAVTSQEAFDEYWFGARSLARVKVLLTNFRARFGVVPEAVAVLKRWPHMDPVTRKLICHWHLQFSDPMYRRFTGEYLVERRQRDRCEVTRDLVLAWVGDQGPGRWTTTTRIQLASKLMSSAYAAGLLASNRGPRQILAPRVQDEALAYLMYLLRGIDFDGTLLRNPYTASVALEGRHLEERLASAPGLRYHRQGDLQDFAWSYRGLAAWGNAFLGVPTEADAVTARLEGNA